MSEHKTAQSNWTPEQKKLYQERRAHHVRGQVGFVNVNDVMTDEDGQEQRIPLGYKKLISKKPRSK